MWWAIVIGVLVLIITTFGGNIGWGLSILISVIAGSLTYFFVRRKNNEK